MRHRRPAVICQRAKQRVDRRRRRADQAAAEIVHCRRTSIADQAERRIEHAGYIIARRDFEVSRHDGVIQRGRIDAANAAAIVAAVGD